MEKENLKKFVNETFVMSLVDHINETAKKHNIEFTNKRKVSLDEMKTLQDCGIEIDQNRQIVDANIYTEIELTRISQKVLEVPQANYPFFEIFNIDGEGSTDASLVYKVFDYSGELTGSVDKGTPKNSIAVKMKAKAYLKQVIDGYTEDISIYEMAVSLAKGSNVVEKMMRSVYLAYIKAIHTIVFTGQDKSGLLTFDHALNNIPEASNVTAQDTWSNLITAGDTTKIYDDVLSVINQMDAKGKGNATNFTPNVMLVSPVDWSKLKGLMKNTGYFNENIRSYLERMLNLKIYPYEGLASATVGQRKTILLNTSEDNMFIGIPNPLEIYSDTKFDTTSQKAKAQTTGLIMINGGAVGYLNGVS